MLKSALNRLEVRIQYAGFLPRLLVALASAGLVAGILRLDRLPLGDPGARAGLLLITLAAAVFVWRVARAFIHGTARPGEPPRSDETHGSWFDVLFLLLVLTAAGQAILGLLLLLWLTYRLLLWLFDANV